MSIGQWIVAAAAVGIVVLIGLLMRHPLPDRPQWRPAGTVPVLWQRLRGLWIGRRHSMRPWRRRQRPRRICERTCPDLVPVIFREKFGADPQWPGELQEIGRQVRARQLHGAPAHSSDSTTEVIERTAS